MSGYLFTRVALILFAVLMPLHLPFSIAHAVDAEKVLGWWASPSPERGASEQIITRIMQPATGAGLLPGDVVLELNGRRASSDRLAAVRAAARPGDAIRLRIRRQGTERTLVVPVGESTFSYAAYRWYRVALAVGAWLVGIGIISLRGGSADARLLGGALLLLGPVTLPVTIPERTGLLALANHVWHLAAAGYRFLLPLLPLLVLLRHSARRKIAESPAVNRSLATLFVLFLGLITDGFRNPLGWVAPGVQQDLRLVTGLLAEAVAIAGLFWIRRDVRSAAAPIRWLGFAVALALVSGAVLSVATLVSIGGSALAEALRQVKALTLAPLPAIVVLYFVLGGRDDAEDDWQARRHASAVVSALFVGLYGFAVAGAAVVALSTLGRNLGGAEWVLFAAVFVATIVFSPVLRWAREAIDRRVFARWMAMERRAHALVDELSGDLEPRSLAVRLRRSLVHILDVHAARLLIASELAADWDIVEQDALGPVERSSIERRLGRARADQGPRIEPIRRPSGEVIGAIEYQLPAGRMGLTPPELTALHTVCQGVAVALRNTESHFALQRANRELAEGERIAALGAMACALAHEIKNPLASLKMGLYLMAKGRFDAERAHRIERDVRRIDDLVSSLFQFSRDADREPRMPIDIRVAVRSAVDDLASLARDRQVRVIQRYPHDPVIIVGGQSEIRVLVSNLLRNSLDVSGPGGRVEVRVDSMFEDALIDVCDMGPGIPHDRQRHVFEMSYSTKPEGGGIGLALARREVEWLGGRIELDSTPGQGTRLRVRLPKATEAREGRTA